jgi:hypothetical protein
MPHHDLVDFQLFNRKLIVAERRPIQASRLAFPYFNLSCPVSQPAKLAEQVHDESVQYGRVNAHGRVRWAVEIDDRILPKTTHDQLAE